MEACRSRGKITNQSYKQMLDVDKVYMHGTVFVYIFSGVPTVVFCGVLTLPFTCYCFPSPLGHASVFLEQENKSFFFSEVLLLLPLPSLKGFNTA